MRRSTTVLLRKRSSAVDRCARYLTSRSYCRPTRRGRHDRATRGPGCTSDRSHAGRPHPRGRRAHVRPRGIGAPRRLGRGGHQDRARRAGRRHAGPGVQRARGHGGRRPRPARARQPGQAEPGSRPHVGGGARHPVPAGGDVRRLPHQQAPEHPVQAPRRRRRHPGAQPAHHLRPRHRPGRAGARCRPWVVRLARLLVPSGHRDRHEAAGVRLRACPTGAGVRRLDRRDDHRRRDHGRAVPPGAHGGGHDRRRVAPRHRHVVDGRGPGAVAPARRGVDPAAAARAHREPAHRHLHDQGREVRVAHVPPGGEVLGRGLCRRRAARAGHRRALRRRRGDQAERRRRGRVAP
jgi:hypothetical protein